MENGVNQFIRATRVAVQSRGRGNGGMQEKHAVQLWLPAATVSPQPAWLVLQRLSGLAERRSACPLWSTMALCCLCLHLGTSSPRLVELKECAALIKDV